MGRRSLIQFVLLSALWGASYLFIKVALEDVSPAVVVCSRTALGALVLLPFALRAGALRGLGKRAGTVAALASVQVAGPFMLISLGEQSISSSLAAILVATAPIFTYLLAIRLDPGERVRGLGLLGVALGIGGVALLLGIDAGGGTAALAGGLMVVAASLGYALGAFYLKRRFAGDQPIGVVTATMAASAAMTLPLAAVSAPADLPGLEALASLATLGVLGTGLAFVLFYGLIVEIGTTRSSLVAYVSPGFSVLYGVALLDEGFGPATAAGLALIVGGSWLAAEARLPWRRSAAAPTGPQPAPETDDLSVLSKPHCPREA